MMKDKLFFILLFLFRFVSLWLRFALFNTQSEIYNLQFDCGYQSSSA